MEEKEKKSIDKILKIFELNKTFFITGHVRPDGDTIGSELALGSWLRKQGKEVDIASAEPIPNHLLFLPGASHIQKKTQVNKRYDVGIILECPTVERMGKIIDLKLLNKTINIDHHIKIEKSSRETMFVEHPCGADVNLVNESVSSCAEIVGKIMKRAEYTPSREEALCLYVGLVTDTGKFQQENTTSSSLQFAAWLVDLGVNPRYVYQNVYGTKSLADLKLLGLALNTLKVEDSGSVAYLEISKQMHKNAGTQVQDTEGMVNYAGMIPGIKIFILFRELSQPNKIKVSLRSYKQVDVRKIAANFGGGGHKNAAGCEIEGSLTEVKNKLLELIRGRT